MLLLEIRFDSGSLRPGHANVTDILNLFPTHFSKNLYYLSWIKTCLSHCFNATYFYMWLSHVLCYLLEYRSNWGKSCALVCSLLIPSLLPPSSSTARARPAPEQKHIEAVMWARGPGSLWGPRRGRGSMYLWGMYRVSPPHAHIP